MTTQLLLHGGGAGKDQVLSLELRGLSQLSGSHSRAQVICQSHGGDLLVLLLLLLRGHQSCMIMVKKVGLVQATGRASCGSHSRQEVVLLQSLGAGGRLALRGGRVCRAVIDG